MNFPKHLWHRVNAPLASPVPRPRSESSAIRLLLTLPPAHRTGPAGAQQALEAFVEYRERALSLTDEQSAHLQTPLEAIRVGTTIGLFVFKIKREWFNRHQSLPSFPLPHKAFLFKFGSFLDTLNF